MPIHFGCQLKALISFIYSATDSAMICFATVLVESFSAGLRYQFRLMCFGFCKEEASLPVNSTSRDDIPRRGS